MLDFFLRFAQALADKLDFVLLTAAQGYGDAERCEHLVLPVQGRSLIHIGGMTLVRAKNAACRILLVRLPRPICPAIFAASMM